MSSEFSWETDNVEIWLNNTNPDYWAEQAKDCDSVEELARQLQDYHEQEIDEALDGRSLPGYAQDMLNMSMSLVNWEAIAEPLWNENHIDDEDEDEEETEEDEEEDNG